MREPRNTLDGNQAVVLQEERTSNPLLFRLSLRSDADSREAYQLIERLTAELAASREQTVRFTRDDAARMTELRAERDRLRAALVEIEKGSGPFNRDQLKFAENVIEEMKGIARKALAGGANETTRVPCACGEPSCTLSCPYCGCDPCDNSNPRCAENGYGCRG